MSEWADMLAEMIDTHDEAATIVIERNWNAALPWSCDLSYDGESGFGVGETLEECVEAAIHDFRERRS